MTTYYASNQSIGDDAFDSQDVTDENVIAATKLASLCGRVQNYMNRIMGRTTDATDVNGELEEVFLYLFKKALSGRPVILSSYDPTEKEMKDNIKINFGTDADAQNAGSAFYIHDPADYDKAGWTDDLG